MAFCFILFFIFLKQLSALSELIFFFIIRLVKSYLLHYGYEETLNAFNLATKTTVPPILIAEENAIDEDDLHQRKTLRKVLNEFYCA